MYLKAQNHEYWDYNLKVYYYYFPVPIPKSSTRTDLDREEKKTRRQISWAIFSGAYAGALISTVTHFQRRLVSFSYIYAVHTRDASVIYRKFYSRF